MAFLSHLDDSCTYSSANIREVIGREGTILVGACALMVTGAAAFEGIKWGINKLRKKAK